MPRPKSVIRHHPESHSILFHQPTLSATKIVIAGLRNVIAGRTKHLVMTIKLDAIHRGSVRFDDIERQCKTHSVQPKCKTVIKAMKLLAEEGEATTKQLMKQVGVCETTALQLKRLIPLIQERLVISFGGLRLMEPLSMTAEEKDEFPY
ncbi:hypothetical protein [Paludibacterium sp. B53371]|uniref:hypothetical protein n=1 Tax=Paludibacterium sp. B53371 TaxID=2806263 RepID=UPI001C03E992|nr:hypothetical protein [Paludibacterium sp. B53371]